MNKGKRKDVFLELHCPVSYQTTFIKDIRSGVRKMETPLPKPYGECCVCNPNLQGSYTSQKSTLYKCKRS